MYRIKVRDKDTLKCLGTLLVPCIRDGVRVLKKTKLQPCIYPTDTISEPSVEAVTVRIKNVVEEEGNRSVAAVAPSDIRAIDQLDYWRGVSGFREH